MDFVFDLQLFADEEATVEVEADEPKEEPKDEPEEQPKEEEVPEELDGLDLSQDEVKEILKEAAPKEEAPKEEPPKADADADSDNKQVPQTEEELPKGNIPYARLKTEIDKRHAMEEEMAKLKEQLANAQKAQPPIQQQPPAPQPQTPPPAQIPSFSPEMARQIDDAVTKQAMLMTGMTKEDVDALEYADESDAKAKTYRYAKDLARATIIGNIQQNAMRQQQQAAVIMQNQQKLVNEFNQFYMEQTAQPDYNDTVQFATNEFFEKQAPGVQFAVTDAYNRVQRNIASPQDILVVKNFFLEAQKEFRAKKAPEPKPAPAPQQQNKPNLPRTSEVSGSATSPKETVTVASLQKMLEETPFEQIPEKYQNLLLGL